MKNILVLFGGQSVEHEVSIITGVMTINSLDKEQFIPVPVYIDKSGEWWTGESLFDIDFYKNFDSKKLKRVTLVGGENILYELKKNRLKRIRAISVGINCMHGGLGENGSVVGALALSKIPLASPPLLPSSVCMDKRFTKIVMKGLGVKCLPYVYAEKESELEQIEQKIPYPMIVKPNEGGSSIGVSVAEDEKQLVRAFRYAKSFGEGVIIEPKLEEFMEINCGAYKTERGVMVSECEQPVGRTKVLSFSDKYQEGKRVFPADIPRKTADKIQALTEKIYLALGAEGVIRIDFFLVKNSVYVNEINTVPGSMAYYLFGNSLKSLKGMCTEMIKLAEKKFAVQNTFNKNYKSSILLGFGNKGAKRLEKRG